MNNPLASPTGAPARRNFAVAAAATLMAVSLAACGSGSDDPKPSASAAKVDSAAAALVPSAVKSSGKLRYAATFGYAPAQFFKEDNVTPDGISVDIGNAVAETLGLKPEWTNVEFNALLPGVLASRYDSAIGAIAVTPARVAQYNMVTYQKSVSGIVVGKDNPKQIKGVEDLCGKTVSSLVGSVYIKTLADASAQHCAGRPPIKVDTYAGSADQFQAVTSGRADALYSDYDATRWQAEHSNGALELIDADYPDKDYGAVFSGKSAELAKAFQAGLAVIIKDGTYAKIMNKWKASNELVVSASIDGPTVKN